MLASLLIKDEDCFTECFKIFIEIAIYNANFFKPHLNALMSLTGNNILNSQLEWSTRQLLIEIYCCILEVNGSAVKRNKNLIIYLIQGCITIMGEVDDDPDWNNKDGSTELESEKIKFLKEVKAILI